METQLHEIHRLIGLAKFKFAYQTVDIILPSIFIVVSIIPCMPSKVLFIYLFIFLKSFKCVWAAIVELTDDLSLTGMTKEKHRIGSARVGV